MPKKQKQVNLDFLSSLAPSTSTRPVLSTMLAVAAEDTASARLIEVDRLADNPYQPRLSLDENGVQELAQVIKSQGFQGVLVARPHPEQPGRFQLTAGHRRREASRLAGLAKLPVIVKDLSDEEMAGLAITENIQREDLTALEEGKIFLLMTDEMGYTHEQIALEIGKNRGYVENRLRVARAPEDVQLLVKTKPDSLRAVSSLIKVKDRQQRAEIIEQLLNGRLTADDLPAYINERLHSLPPAGADSYKTGRPASLPRLRSLEISSELCSGRGSAGWRPSCARSGRTGKNLMNGRRSARLKSKRWTR